MENFPTINEIKDMVNKLTYGLYNAWKKVLCERLLNLEFTGIILANELNLPDKIWRLPNDALQTALMFLQDDLEKLGYEFSFTFDDVQNKKFSLIYDIDLPELDIELDEQDLTEMYGEKNEKSTQTEENTKNEIEDDLLIFEY